MDLFIYCLIGAFLAAIIGIADSIAQYFVPSLLASIVIIGVSLLIAAYCNKRRK